MVKKGFLKNNWLKKKNQLSNRKPIIGWLCTYTPKEILLAADLLPVRILPRIDPSLANTYLDSNFCPFARSCLGEVQEGDFKELEHLLLVNSCDAIRRFYDARRYYHFPKNSFIYLLDLPRKDSTQALAYFQSNLELLVRRIEEFFQIKISENLLLQAISNCNKIRKLLNKLYHLYASDKIDLSGESFIQIIQQGMILPLKEYQIFLEKELKDFFQPEKESFYNKKYQTKRNPKLLVSGTWLDDLRLIRVIENYGGKVVFFDLCNGNRSFQGPIKIPEEKVNNRESILEILAEFYLHKLPCPRMVNLEKRWEYLNQIIQDYQIEGVVFYNLKFCDTSMFELPILRERLQKKRIPSLFLEGEFSAQISGRNRTRIQAFLEVLEFGR
ncbi:MAG: 2-hydroxyacyl-CoA dehydratase family protein [Candidatus Caldatribacteriota bacterium]